MTTTTDENSDHDHDSNDTRTIATGIVRDEDAVTAAAATTTTTTTTTTEEEKEEENVKEEETSTRTSDDSYHDDDLELQRQKEQILNLTSTTPPPPTITTTTTNDDNTNDNNPNTNINDERRRNTYNRLSSSSSLIMTNMMSSNQNATPTTTNTDNGEREEEEEVVDTTLSSSDQNDSVPFPASLDNYSSTLDAETIIALVTGQALEEEEDLRQAQEQKEEQLYDNTSTTDNIMNDNDNHHTNPQVFMATKLQEKQEQPEEEEEVQQQAEEEQAETLVPGAVSIPGPGVAATTMMRVNDGGELSLSLIEVSRVIADDSSSSTSSSGTYQIDNDHHRDNNAEQQQQQQQQHDEHLVSAYLVDDDTEMRQQQQQQQQQIQEIRTTSATTDGVPMTGLSADETHRSSSMAIVVEAEPLMTTTEDQNNKEHHNHKRKVVLKSILRYCIITFFLIMVFVITLVVVNNNNKNNTNTTIDDTVDPATLSTEPTTAMSMTSTAPVASPPPSALGKIVPLLVMIQLDHKAVETGWNLECYDSIDKKPKTIFDVPTGTYDDFETYRNALIVETTTLNNIRVGEECNFTLQDSQGDGIFLGSVKIYVDKYYQISENLILEWKAPDAWTSEGSKLSEESNFTHELVLPFIVPEPTTDFQPETKGTLFAITSAKNCSTTLAYGPFTKFVKVLDNSEKDDTDDNEETVVEVVWDEESPYFCTDCVLVPHREWEQYFYDEGNLFMKLQWNFTSNKTLQERFDDAALHGEETVWTVQMYRGYRFNSTFLESNSTIEYGDPLVRPGTWWWTTDSVLGKDKRTYPITSTSSNTSGPDFSQQEGCWAAPFSTGGHVSGGYDNFDDSLKRDVSYGQCDLEAGGTFYQSSRCDQVWIKSVLQTMEGLTTKLYAKLQ